MQERHTNRSRYFKEQDITTEKHVIPFIQEKLALNSDAHILEIGCGEGGNLAPFVRMGCARIVGIDLAKNKIENAIRYYDDFEGGTKPEFIAEDIYNIDPETLGTFDLIYTRDVLEHIHDQEKFMEFVKRFIKPGGKFFLGFPPWHNPFGGHQQICRSKLLSVLPFYHILPVPIYRFILKSFGESEATIENLLEVKETGITIERFEHILSRTQYQKDKRVFYFINPNYEIKFKLKPRAVWSFIGAIPFVRNFFITTNYYLVSVRDK